MESTVVVRVRTHASCFNRETDKFHGIGGDGVVATVAGSRLEGHVWLGLRFSFPSPSSSRTSSASANCSLMLALKVALWH